MSQVLPTFSAVRMSQARVKHIRDVMMSLTSRLNLICVVGGKCGGLSYVGLGLWQKFWSIRSENPPPACAPPPPKKKSLPKSPSQLSKLFPGLDASSSARLSLQQLPFM
eukprot:358690-Chlamydomonas_euryale.AAC.3